MQSLCGSTPKPRKKYKKKGPPPPEGMLCQGGCGFAKREKLIRFRGHWLCPDCLCQEPSEEYMKIQRHICTYKEY